jgi:hypothetical protein
MLPCIKPCILSEGFKPPLRVSLRVSFSGGLAGSPVRGFYPARTAPGAQLTGSLLYDRIFSHLMFNNIRIIRMDLLSMKKGFSLCLVFLFITAVFLPAYATISTSPSVGMQKLIPERQYHLSLKTPEGWSEFASLSCDKLFRAQQVSIPGSPYGKKYHRSGRSPCGPQFALTGNNASGIG